MAASLLSCLSSDVASLETQSLFRWSEEGRPLSDKTLLCFLYVCLNLGDFLAHLRALCPPPSAGRGAPENKTLLSSMALFPAPRLTHSKSPPKWVE